MRLLSGPKGRLITAFITLFILASAPAATLSGSEQEQVQIQKAKIFQDTAPLINESDLYCHIFLWNGPLPDLRIAAAESGSDKILLTDTDIVYLNKGKDDGLEIGQMFSVLDVGSQIGSFGNLVQRRGRLQVTFLEAKRAVARIEKSCGKVTVGNYLVPFEEKEGILGKDLGVETYSEIGKDPVGSIIYLQDDFKEIGTGHQALIDIGKDDGLQIGQQMIVFKKVRPDMPRAVLANVIVIDTQAKTSTVKVLSAHDAVRVGQQVQAR